MSGRDNFPSESNAFSDPSIAQATQGSKEVTSDINDYNPFADTTTSSTYSKPTVDTAAILPTREPQPAVMIPSQYNSEIQRHIEQLEKRAEDLDRRESVLQSQTMAFREKNFPPLPKFCPIKPCFHQDIHVDIPMDFQKYVRYALYLWLCFNLSLLVNTVAALAYLIADSAGGVTFGLSIVWLILLSPCSYVCWFRPIYKAFRDDSSMNFMIFFFVFFIHFVFTILMAIGLYGWGFCGLFLMIKLFSTTGVGYKAAAIVSLFSTACFAFVLGMSFLLLFKIQRVYRSTGASLMKAQQEFSGNFWANPHTQRAATEIAKSAVGSAMGATDYGSTQTASGVRY